QAHTTCLLCRDSMDNQLSYRTMVCPACKHSWFHRECIQSWKQDRTGKAMTACTCHLPGWQQELLNIPFSTRLPSWEDQEQELQELAQVHSRCDASECLCPGGREVAEQEG
ncbi:G2E3 ligase, partial [Psilopogon haemacephalus]|nr:G2E3 ligase [Psilopogon haemacephalus]